MPALFGNPWLNAGALTLSFAPDGTPIAGCRQGAPGTTQPSALFDALSGAGTADQWQTEILRAFQTWAVNANINIGLVPDGGGAFGTYGASGDLRIGANAGTGEVIAINSPYNALAGAWSGDVLLNTTKNFSVGARPGRYDLFTVMLDEAGNVFGLEDNATDQSSALYGSYVGAKTGLTPGDAAAIQRLYGARTPDAFEGAGNGTRATATRLVPAPARNGVAAVGADLTTMSDVDYYTFTTGADTTSLTVRLGTVGKSLLAAKVSVYDSTGALVGTATSAGPLATQDLVLTVAGVRPGADYTVKVERATDDVFGIGRYDLSVGYNAAPPTAPAAVQPPAVTAANNSLATAAPLAAGAGSGGAWFTQRGAIAAASSANYYTLTAPATPSTALIVSVRSDAPGALFTAVTVYDASGTAVASELLADGADGRVVVQVAHPVASGTYYLKVESVSRGAAGRTGAYTLLANFTQPAVSLAGVATDTLTAARAASYTTLSVAETKLFHFVLSATSSDPATVSGMRMIIYGSDFRVVATLTADAGATSSGAVLLSAGTYYVKFEAATRTGVALPPLTYTLRTAILSDPIDPFAPADPTLPAPAPAPADPFTVSQQADPIYLALPLFDPWATPWVP